MNNIQYSISCLQSPKVLRKSQNIPLCAWCSVGCPWRGLLYQGVFLCAKKRGTVWNVLVIQLLPYYTNFPSALDQQISKRQTCGWHLNSQQSFSSSEEGQAFSCLGHSPGTLCHHSLLVGPEAKLWLARNMKLSWYEGYTVPEPFEMFRGGL